MQTLEKTMGRGPHDVGLLMAIDGLLRSSDRGKLAGLVVVDPDSGEQVHAGEYWVRASVDRNILEVLGRDPGAMTRLEYLRQGVAFSALSAAAAFDLAVEHEKHMVRLRNGIDVVAAMREREEADHVH